MSINNEWNYSSSSEPLLDITPQWASQEILRNELVSEVIQVIGQGKEAIVLWCKDHDSNYIAVKMYKLYRSTHRKTILNTSRAHPYDIISHFAKTEYWKMKDLYSMSIPMPKPIELKNYAFSMEFLGSEEAPAPLLRDMSKSSFVDPSDILEQIIEILRSMIVDAHYIHGDFNEHNLVYSDDKVYVIDFLQAKRFALKGHVSSNSPLLPLSKAYKYINIDLQNILNFFNRKFRIKANFHEAMIYVLGDIKEKIDEVLMNNKEDEKVRSHNLIY